MPDDADGPINLQSRPDVDENLFAFRLLANTYSNWPDLKDNRDNVSAWFQSARASATSMRAQIGRGGLDPELLSAYGDLLDYISATQLFLQNVDTIAKQKSDRAVTDAVVSLWDALQTASDTEDKAKLLLSPKHAETAGQLAGTVAAANNLVTRSDARDASERVAVAAEADKLQTRWSTTLSHLQTTASRLSAKYGWPRSEAGFDGYSASRLADSIARSPRDPFLQSQLGDALLSSAKSANDAFPAIKAYLTAAMLVPPGSVYDTIRLQFMQDAMLAAVTEAYLDKGGWYTSQTTMYHDALKVTRTYLAMDPADRTGVGHAQLARALAFAGRYEEAAYSAQAAMNLDQSWRNDPGFCIRYAKLMSLNGNQELALSSMQRSFEVGYTAVSALKTDPDFASLRAQRPAQFAALTAMKWNWHIKFGSGTPDDVVIQNDSAFNFKHAKLAMHVQQGQTVWDKQVGCDFIQAGHSCQVDHVFFIIGSHTDVATASLTIDPK